MSALTAREVAFRVLRRVFEQGAYADRALHGEASALEPRERALATALVYGAVQRRATLDHLAQSLAGRPMQRLDPPVRAALRLGLLQLLFLDGIAPHAAVHESVELAKRGGSRRGAGLVNAVLRRAAGEGRELLAGLSDTTPQQAAIKHSVPGWLAEMWFEELGPERARSLLEAVNRPAEAALRVNTLRATAEEVRSRLPVASHQATGLPEGLVLQGPFDVHGSDLFGDGLVMPQSRGSMRVARALSPEPGDAVLDLCAAPGGKTTHLAALMEGRGEIVAVERHPGRAAALVRTCRRMGADGVRVAVGDAAEWKPGPRRFGRILVDPPCSGLGTLQSRPDLRWRVSPESISELAALQRRILAAGAAATAPHGTLVYSVCTISRAESAAVVEGLLSDESSWSLEHAEQLAPDSDGTDGFYIARLRRGGD